MNTDHALTVISEPVTCEGCGKCCMHLSTPPFLDYEWPFIPDELKAEIEAAQAAGRRDFDGLGCIWFDHETKRCREYGDRPDVCENFEVGKEDCLAFRNGERG